MPTFPGSTPNKSPGKHDQRQGRSITQLLTDEFGVPFVLGQLELAIIRKLLVCACGFCKSLCVPYRYLGSNIPIQERIDGGLGRAVELGTHGLGFRV